MLIYAPDATDIAPEILTALSGIPTMRGYQSPPTAFDFTSSTLAADATGGAWVRSEGSQRGFVATAAAIYEYGSDTFTDRSRGGGYSGAAYWKFVAFGSTYLAVAQGVQLQKSTSAAFSNVTAPSAVAMDAAGYFVMLGACNDTGVGLSTSFGAQLDRWWCSRYADAVSAWEPSVTTQCATGLLSDTPGGIKDIKAWGNDFIVYKPTSMYRAYHVGPPEVFKFELISNSIGSAGGVVKTETSHFFIGPDDIYKFDGTRPVPIGAGIRESFFSGLDRANLTEVLGRLDPVNQLIYWHYRPTGASGALTKVLVFHYPTGRFGVFDLSVQVVLGTDNAKLVAATSDGTARQLSMAYIGSDKKIYSLTAAGTALTLTTTWYGDPNEASFVDRVYTKFRDGAGPSSGTITHSTCRNIGGTVTTGSALSWSAGRTDLRANARFHRDAHSYVGNCELEVASPRVVAESVE